MKSQRAARGFSLVELLVSMTALSLLMLALAQLTGSAQRAWEKGRSRPNAFREARTAFQNIQEQFREVALHPTLEWEFSPGAPTIPMGYQPRADRIFRCGPAETLLSGAELQTGHALILPAEGQGHRCLAVVLQDDAERLPAGTGAFGISPKRRFRLMQYDLPQTIAPVLSLSTASPRVVAENIVLMILVPLGDAAQANPYLLAPSLTYDSSQNGHRLPAQVRLLLVSMDEASASRVAQAGCEHRLVPGTLFAQSASAESLSSDITALRRHLDAGLGPDLRLNFEILDTTLPLPAWTRES
jgi:prepilin-type N-terminal cleavage/methylation domain-containing protein